MKDPAFQVFREDLQEDRWAPGGRWDHLDLQDPEDFSRHLDLVEDRVPDKVMDAN